MFIKTKTFMSFFPSFKKKSLIKTYILKETFDDYSAHWWQKKGQTIFEHSSISSNMKMHFENLR